LNRTQYGIKEGDLKFVGVDVWNCYEVSFLLSNGFPVAGAIRLKYSSDSESIVESKSLKLYLNSFNMEKFDTTNTKEAIESVKLRISNDLGHALKTEVGVEFLDHDSTQYSYPLDVYHRLESVVDAEKLIFNSFNEDPSILVKAGPGIAKVCSSLLRSNCRVTNQPDWGDVFIYMEGNSLPTDESLLRYIISMRKENHFHEEICECIYQRLYDIFDPDALVVGCLYTRRGGIDINPLRATDMKSLDKLHGMYMGLSKSFKTLRQ
jgi:7-cyano-7-deazaguanine reductase